MRIERPGRPTLQEQGRFLIAFAVALVLSIIGINLGVEQPGNGVVTARVITTVFFFAYAVVTLRYHSNNGSLWKVMVGLGSFGYALMMLSAGGFLGIVALACFAYGMYELIKFRKNRPERAEDFVDRDEALSDVFGASTDLAAVFGQKGERGADGEAETIRMVDQYVRRSLPELKTYNGLRFAPSSDADMDHVLLYGRNLALVDTKNYRPGHYVFREHPSNAGIITATRVDQQGFPLEDPIPLKIRASVNSYEQHIPNAKIRSFVMLQEIAGPVTIEDHTNGDVIIGTANQVMPQLVAFLAEQGQQHVVDRYVMAALHPFFKHDMNSIQLQ